MKLKNKIFFLEGSKIYLRPFELKDVTIKYLRWVNNPDLNKGIEGRFPINLTQAKNFFSSKKNSNNDVLFAICLRKNNLHIGNALISNVDWINKRCRYGRIIGEKKFRSKGYGSEITRLIQKYVFEKINMNTLFTGCREDNISSIKSNLKSGMSIEGKSKEAIYHNGKYYAEIRFGITKKTYFKIKG